MKDQISLVRKIREDERRHPEASGVLTHLLEQIAFASKVISREVNKAGLVDILGLTGDVNVQGEDVRKLDAFANDTIHFMLRESGQLAGFASEEEEIHAVFGDGPGYLVLCDPLDGSSNIDANVSIGTIFSILRQETQGPPRLEDFLRPGVEQVAAGYVIYGSSTMFVYTTGCGVHGFTLDASVGEFLLSHPDIRIPERGKIFSANLGNLSRWSKGLRAYMSYLASPENAQGSPYSLRYIGSLVADFHRNLLYGGVFLYPGDEKKPEGKLRLLYEANPMAKLVEEAGGRASTGSGRILRQVPSQLHERTPLIIGSALDVGEAEAFLRGEHPALGIVAR